MISTEDMRLLADRNSTEPLSEDVQDFINTMDALVESVADWCEKFDSMEQSINVASSRNEIDASKLERMKGRLEKEIADKVTSKCDNIKTGMKNRTKDKSDKTKRKLIADAKAIIKFTNKFYKTAPIPVVILLGPKLMAPITLVSSVIVGVNSPKSEKSAMLDDLKEINIILGRRIVECTSESNAKGAKVLQSISDKIKVCCDRCDAALAENLAESIGWHAMKAAEINNGGDIDG